jgi:hypothetical protein
VLLLFLDAPALLARLCFSTESRMLTPRDYLHPLKSTNATNLVPFRFIAQARGECQYFSEESIPTAGEGCKSNALLRCCKDLGVASELWDPRFIRTFKKEHCQEIWVEHVVNKKRRQVWVLKGVDPAYPYAAVRPGAPPIAVRPGASPIAVRKV